MFTSPQTPHAGVSTHSTGCIWPRRAVLGTILPVLCGIAAGRAQAEPPEFCVTCTGPQAQYRCTFEDNGGQASAPGLQLYCISTLAREGKHESCAIGRATKQACPGTLKVLAMPDLPPSEPSAAEAPTAPAPARSMVRAPVAPPSDDVEMHGSTPGKLTTPSPPQPAAPPQAEAPAPAAKTVAVPPPAAAAAKSDAKPAWNGSSGAPTPAAASPSATNEQAKSDEAGSEPEAPDTPALVKPLETAGKAVGEAAKSTGSALSKAGDAVGSAAKKSWKCLTSLFGDC